MAPKCLVKTTCDVQQNTLFGKALMWPLWIKRLMPNEENRKGKERRRRDQVGVNMI